MSWFHISIVHLFLYNLSQQIPLLPDMKICKPYLLAKLGHVPFLKHSFETEEFLAEMIIIGFTSLFILHFIYLYYIHILFVIHSLICVFVKFCVCIRKSLYVYVCVKCVWGGEEEKEGEGEGMIAFLSICEDMGLKGYKKTCRNCVFSSSM